MIAIQFEYLTKILVRAEFLPTLNALGKEGWELVGLLPTAMIIDGQIATEKNTCFVECVFKRIKPNNPFAALAPHVDNGVQIKTDVNIKRRGNEFWNPDATDENSTQ